MVWVLFIFSLKMESTPDITEKQWIDSFSESLGHFGTVFGQRTQTSERGVNLFDLRSVVTPERPRKESPRLS